MTVERPAGVTAVAAAFLLAAVYLLVVGLTMLVRPDVVGMSVGCGIAGRLLELAGPYTFLLVAALEPLIALGLWRLQPMGPLDGNSPGRDRTRDAGPKRLQRGRLFSHRQNWLWVSLGVICQDDDRLVSVSGTSCRRVRCARKSLVSFL